MQKMADEKMISESDKWNKLYAEVESWKDGNVMEEAFFTVPKDDIGVKRDEFILKKGRRAVEIFLNMIGRLDKSISSSETLARLLQSTNDYIQKHWTEKNICHPPGKLAVDRAGPGSPKNYRNRGSGNRKNK